MDKEALVTRCVDQLAGKVEEQAAVLAGQLWPDEMQSQDLDVLFTHHQKAVELLLEGLKEQLS